MKITPIVEGEKIVLMDGERRIAELSIHEALSLSTELEWAVNDARKEVSTAA